MILIRFGNLAFTEAKFADNVLNINKYALGIMRRWYDDKRYFKDPEVEKLKKAKECENTLNRLDLLKRVYDDNKTDLLSSLPAPGVNDIIYIKKLFPQDSDISEKEILNNEVYRGVFYSRYIPEKYLSFYNFAIVNGFNSNDIESYSRKNGGLNDI